MPGLPHNIASIAGYSSKTHRAYFRDRRGVAVLSSRDGDTFEVASKVDSNTAPAVEVPGHAKSAIGEKKWRNTAYKGGVSSKVCQIIGQKASNLSSSS